MEVRCLMSIFRLYPGLKLSFEHTSGRKNLFLSASFFWDTRLFVREMDQNIYLVEPLVLVARTWFSYFFISKILDYMKYYMMLSEK